MKTILKPLSWKYYPNLSILTNGTYKDSQNKTVVVENNDKNPTNVPFKILKRTINVMNVKNWK